MRIIFCGGRDYADQDTVGLVMFALRGDATLIHGDCPTGLDAYVEFIAMATGHRTEPHPADWDQHGRAAGPIRNQQMLDAKPIDLVIAFPGGRGTADMVSRAREAGVPVMEVT